MGLSSVEARRRLERAGPNALPEARPEPGWRRLVRQFRSPLIYILLLALLLDLAAWAGGLREGVPVEATAIATILLLNAMLGAWLERKAEGALARLKQLGAPQAWVLRDGALTRVPGAELVCGDVVRLEAGDRVPADARVGAADHLLLDESVLTGESVPVDRRTGEEVSAGTLVVRGHAHVEVTRTGLASAMGRIAALLGEIKEEPTPLERRLTAFGGRVARAVLGLVVVVGAAGLWAEGSSRAAEVVFFAVALAVAVVPEGLPAVLTLTLAQGVERMARRRAVVRRLAAVEALGSVTVIAADKTGTITENRMDVRQADVTDAGRALDAMVLASETDGSLEAGDPLELALVRYAEAAGRDAEAMRAAFSRRSSRPFDSAWKFMRVSNGAVSYLKGAPEALLERSRLPDGERAAWSAKAAAYAAAGHRVLALAWADGERETDLDWLGLVALWDAPRPEVAPAVRQARAAGIRIVMMTGDHPATALAVARAVGIEAAEAVSGTDLDALPDAELRRVVAEATVFARVAPEHKLRIVTALKAAGEIVAVTGDGVNDAPALKRADVGVAMGQRGSDVGREVADLVLLDDNFATIVAAVEEGRSIYENIRKFVRFLFSTNLAEMLVVVLGVVAAFLLDLRDAAGHLLLPLTAAQLLWINLVTDGAPALALGRDRNPGVMQRPPRDPAAPLLDRPSARFIAVAGGVTALVALLTLWALPRHLGQSVEATRTAMFLLLAAGQVLVAYPARRNDARPAPNATLHGAVGASLVLQLLVVGVAGLPIVAAAWVGGAILVSWALAEAAAWVVWREDSLRLPSRSPQARPPYVGP